MYPIVETEWLGPDVKRLRVHAPRIARRAEAGQFVIVRVHDHGERIPLTIADHDPEAQTITLIVQGIGKTTRLINSLVAGDALLDVVGPLGNPSEVRRFGTVVVIGGGVGTAIAYPTAKAMYQAGNRVLSILGARTADLLILADEMQATSDVLYVMTDDGSAGEQGLVSDKLTELLEGGEPIHRVLAIGPIPMMRAVAEVTRPAGIPTIVSLNSIMVDGTGMCGGCRVVVGGAARFACVEGPEFDAHQVDFDMLAERNRMYRESEQKATAEFEAHPEHDLERVPGTCRLEERHPELARLRETPNSS